MTNRTTSLGVLLLSSLLAAVPASADDPRPGGGVRIDLSRMEFSLPLQARAFVGTICQGDPPPHLGSAGQCRLKSSPFGHVVTGRAEGLVEVMTSTQAAARMVWRATGLDPMEMEPIETSCGVVTVSLKLEPDVAQPPSRFILKPLDDTGRRGFFSGVMRLKARLVLTHAATGRVREIPLAVALGLTGSFDFTVKSNSKAISEVDVPTLYAEWLLGPQTCLPEEIFAGAEGERIWETLRSEGCPICGYGEYMDWEDTDSMDGEPAGEGVVP